MEQYNQIVNTIALTMGASWASGINLYAAILMLGLLGMTGDALPPSLQILSNPVVMGLSGLMYVLEFFADKIPGVDTGWDTVHTFIRIPAGALLAMGAVGEVNEVFVVGAALIGGAMATGTHAAKAGSRVAINTSPEPFTNWAVSIGEDVAVIAGIWAALKHPVVFIVLLTCFIVLLAWLLPKVWKGIKKVFSFIGRVFGRREHPVQE